MLLRLILAVCLAGLLSACTATRPALAPAEQPLRVVAFPGGSNWPLWVAMDIGKNRAALYRLTAASGSGRLPADITKSVVVAAEMIEEHSFL